MFCFNGNNFNCGSIWETLCRYLGVACYGNMFWRPKGPGPRGPLVLQPACPRGANMAHVRCRTA